MQYNLNQGDGLHIIPNVPIDLVIVYGDVTLIQKTLLFQGYAVVSTCPYSLCF